MPFGSVLQLYCENRRRDRIKTVCYAENCIPAPKLERDDADIKGCSFALFACEKEAALAVIGEIEMGEGLPHPMLDGEWLKTSRKAVCSYMISEFGVDNIDKMLAYAKKEAFLISIIRNPLIPGGILNSGRTGFLREIRL